MTGFIGALFGLFGSKKANNQSVPQPKTSNRAEAFFLDSDSSKGLGDFNYMRTPKSVKKSYPTAVGKLNLITGEIEESISAMEKKQTTGMSKTVSSTPTPSISSASSSFKPTSTTPRRSADSGMDMFRNMARDIKKKK
ncbi:MAG: hypothetical protein WBA93_26625 [Microcoleaceae cyanobacterium]